MTNFDVLNDYFTEKHVFNVFIFASNVRNNCASKHRHHPSIYPSTHLLKTQHIQQVIKATDQMKQQGSEKHLQLPRNNSLSKL